MRLHKRGTGRKLANRKDTFSWERTVLCIANKGLTIFEVVKTNSFLSAKMAKRSQKLAVNPPNKRH
jgi:hypothetical protein